MTWGTNMTSDDILARIDAALFERFTPAKHAFHKGLSNINLTRNYEWTSPDGMGYSGQLEHRPRFEKGPHHHYVESDFAAHPGGGSAQWHAHNLPADPTDTLATVHNATVDYLQHVVAKHRPNVTHVEIASTPVISHKDIETGAQGAESQRGRLYVKLAKRIATHDPRLAGAAVEHTSKGVNLSFHVHFPKGIKAHFDALKAAKPA